MPRGWSPTAYARTPDKIGSLIPFGEANELMRERIRNRVTIDENGCWLWPSKNPATGYVQISFRGKRVGLHRLAFSLFLLPVPEGLAVLHSCDVRHCCNPDHLRLGTISDNKQDELKRGRNFEANRTHCPRGHAYVEHGVHHGPKGWRHCRLCARAKERRKAGWPEDRLFDPPIPKGARTERRTFSGRRSAHS